MKHVKHISSIKYTQHGVTSFLLGVKNIFNQLKDEETLQGYATESYKKEKIKQKTRKKKQTNNFSLVCTFLEALKPQEGTA